MIVLLALSMGCTFYFGDTACDSATIRVDADSLTRSSTSDWTSPAVGDRFACAIEAPAPGFPATAASMTAVACFGEPPATPDELQAFTRDITQLRAGGGLLCALAPQDAVGNPPALRCWGPEADIINQGVAADIRDHDMAIEDVQVAAGRVCVRADDGRSDFIQVRCYGQTTTGRDPEPADVLSYTDVRVTETMGCSRHDGAAGTPEFRCWGELDPTVGETLASIPPDACWSTFDVTDGLLCANTGPGCSSLPPVGCWGDANHPAVLGLDAVTSRLESRSTAGGGLPLGVELGVDFGCAVYGTEPADGGSSLVCFGAAGPSIADAPAGAGIADLAVSPGGALACAIETDGLPSEPGAAPVGTLVCWGDTIELP